MAEKRATTNQRRQAGPLREQPLAQTIADHIGENVYLCYQCVKCTSGCPLAEHMDLNPNQVLRAVQLGDESVLESKTIWVCASCQTCTTRCPQGIDIAAIMDELRIEAKRRGIKPAIPEVDRFSRVFLADVRLMGRSYEVGLMGTLNLVNRNLFKDMDLAVEMLKRRKLPILPSLPTRPPKLSKVKPVEPAANKIAYYPGCSLHSSAAEYGKTIEAVAEALDLELVEPPGWICCGSSPAHSTDHVLATKYPIINLSIIEKMGLDEVTAPCAACYSRFKAAAHEMAHNSDIARQVNQGIGYEYQGKVRVMHLVEALIEKVGLDKIEAAVKKPLEGLKVACYYGCYITRPADITGAEHPEYPMEMDYLMQRLGAEVVDWDYKTDCCGGSLGLTQTPIAHEMTAKVLRNARERGADAVVTVCPLCHLNIDGRQGQIKDLGFSIPIFYATQLATIAFGLGEKAALLNKNIVDPRPLLREKGLI
jgi:heterodisulfide reductase subunit B